MGCDIHPEFFDSNHNQLYGLDFFSRRSYDLFGFLADVRNYSEAPPVAPRRGYPDWRPSNGDWSFHSATWLTLEELLEVDYSREFVDERERNGFNRNGATHIMAGRVVSLREFPGEWYFEELDRMKAAGVAYIFMQFDS